jgi:hypothetical protein
MGEDAPFWSLGELQRRAKNEYSRDRVRAAPAVRFASEHPSVLNQKRPRGAQPQLQRAMALRLVEAQVRSIDLA